MKAHTQITLRPGTSADLATLGEIDSDADVLFEAAGCRRRAQQRVVMRRRVAT